ncbi:retrograde regulation protein 2 [Exophiala aquamarina CBS 119918]|uniref:Retrograde regulation protein 2 n=1 Tax=Exophiala aquamarina CBS 119918 TaxID=1182545 RepID=A0A072PCM3_9EURO|nr:retrograde regulation protein 2 [Exophiala aquamarina CBS 119918]KEF53285.1 retrograde regulation protein 2 [Exophiala aquamarina CBS 119918]
MVRQQWDPVFHIRSIATYITNTTDSSRPQFDLKGKRIPIPDSVTRAVIASFLRFKIICGDFEVPENQIRIIATEATREALNSAEFIAAIKKETGLTVEVLPKGEEGKIGAMGIASSFTYVGGLVMDLGGGSTQISWMVSREGQVQTSPAGAFSFPYGAAAMTRILDDIKAGKSKEEADKALAKLREDMKKKFLDAYRNLEIPQELIDIARLYGGFQLYLCGGGFRGWGYLLLYQSQVHGHHYPISIINGYKADKVHFESTEELKHIAHTANKIFRISDRRRAQVPAVAFLVNVLSEAIPFGIKEAQFCQGGVREGVLFQELPIHTRREHPLQVATARYARPSAMALGDLLLSAIPISMGNEPRSFPRSISTDIIRSLANVFFEYSDVSKESSSSAALSSTTTGILASAHGVSHSDRALLALMFEERFEGELPPREADYKTALSDILTPEEVWWTRYIGKVAMTVARVYPTGVMEEGEPRVKISAQWVAGLGRHGNKNGIELKFSVPKVPNDPLMRKPVLEDLLHVIQKVGKRKNWVGGKEGWGIKVKVIVEEDEWVDGEEVWHIEGQPFDVESQGYQSASRGQLL